MKRRRRSQRTEVDEDEGSPIDIIPLIDVMFLLLCFFIFMTLAMVVQEGVNVSLARAESSTSVQQKEPIVVSIDEQGTLFLNKEETTEDRIIAQLKKRAGEDSDRPVFINADQEARHKRVMLALDSVRQAGLKNVTFTVEPQG
jgi:biopolymer transport protein ExbD